MVILNLCPILSMFILRYRYHITIFRKTKMNMTSLLKKSSRMAILSLIEKCQGRTYCNITGVSLTGKKILTLFQNDYAILNHGPWLLIGFFLNSYPIGYLTETF